MARAATQAARACWLAATLIAAHGCSDDSNEASDHAASHATSAGTNGAHAGAGTNGAQSGAGTSGARAGGDSAGHTAGAAATTPEAESDPGTFTHIYDHVLTNCKVVACHGSGLGGLDMSSRDAAFASLVAHAPDPESKCADFPSSRVVPGSADDSLIVQKVTGPRAPCGMHMPPGGQLSESARTELAQWIDDGAADD